MKPLPFTLAAAALLLLGACRPAVSVHTVPALGVKAVLTPVGSDTLLSLTIPRQEAPWTVAFPGGEPEGLTTEEIPGQTIVRWKADDAHLKASPPRPYFVTLQANGRTYTATVGFQGPGQQVTLAVVKAAIANGH